LNSQQQAQGNFIKRIEPTEQYLKSSNNYNKSSTGEEEPEKEK
jgi:hypothetical protein